MLPAVMPTYNRLDLSFTHGKGAYLYATDGRRYLDFASGIAVNSLGHCHPHLVKALKDQAEKLWHTSNLYRVPEQEKLAKRLVDSTFADTVFFGNSGAEAMECAIKVARKYQSAKGHPEKARIIAVEGAFHGRTLTTLAAAGNKKYLDGFGPVAGGFDHVPFGNMNELRNAITPETGAIIVEPVQGEGGIRPASLDYLRQLRAVADEYDLLLVFDEVQCGVGRTGKLFAHEWAGVTPDVMAVAKGIGGGFPMGACLANEKAAAAMTYGTHGSTFGGNPLAMAVGNAVMDVVSDPAFLAQVDKVARDYWVKLEKLVARNPAVFEQVRGAGLMLGLKCVLPNGDVQTAFRNEGLLIVGAAENVVRILPPLNISATEVDESIQMMETAAQKLVS
ncbi:aspartate aminotransferase family protein [Oceanibaculum pacificum]|uniref:Acetylornithine aminotransferase n=1 Tax=Oceanibaculum pacificum TaxID=580166 RepID=A0A154WGF9_9PROT|nr:aspartate aminotransferase family protein [Oceanibaculum pacificum]KZD12576.1 acetylornithine aminotransferase [Oceanibaculum pacificum]